MNLDLLVDPLFRVPFLTGLLLAGLLPLIGMYLRLRGEWLAALAFAQMASAGARARSSAWSVGVSRKPVPPKSTPLKDWPRRAGRRRGRGSARPGRRSLAIVNNPGAPETTCPTTAV